MSYTHSEHFETLMEMFLGDFRSAYRAIPSKQKTKLLTYITCFYRHWNYSSLVENTILSPSNLHSVFEKTNKKSKISFVTPCFPNKPTIRSISFAESLYTLEKHPVVDDLQCLLKFCVPTANLDADNHLIVPDEHSMLIQLAIYDPFYVDYLTDLAFQLKLFKKIPSIHSNQVQLSAKAVDELFTLSKREIFDRIVEASIDISTANILGVLPVAPRALGRDYIVSLLQKPRDTDTIFEELYGAIGIDIHSFLNMEDDGGLGDIYNTMMSGTFYIGIMLDKYFYTIFGFYLKLINPGYVIPSDFKTEFECALEALQFSDDISMGLFAPCSHYWLTAMGCEYLSIVPSQDELANLREIPANIILEIVRRGAQMSRIGGQPLTNGAVKQGDEVLDEKIYELKIRLTCNKNYWKNIEIPESMNLHDIYMYLCYEFGCDVTMNYSFFPDTDANVFTAYTSPQNKRKSKKADKSSLNDLQLSEKSKFLFVLYDLVNPYAEEVVPVKELRFELDVLKIKNSNSQRHYPYVSRISQTFKDFEFYDEW